MQTLIKLSVGRYIPSDTLDVSDAVDKLMGERVSRLLPPDAKIDPNTFRDERLYTLEVESMFRTHLNSLHALFEAYAGVGPTGQPDLMSLPEFVSLLWHMELLDDDFTAKDGTLCFQWSGMRVIDEVKARQRLLNINLVDFFEALLRVAWRKRLPTPEMVRKAGRRSPGEYYMELRQNSVAFASYLDAHVRQGLLSGDPVGMPPKIALETLLSVICSAIRGAAGSSATSQDLTTEEVKMHMAKKQQELEE